MSLLSDTELTAIARNHARVAAIPTQAETIDLFTAGEQGVAPTLCGETTERAGRAQSDNRQSCLLFQ